MTSRTRRQLPGSEAMTHFEVECQDGTPTHAAGLTSKRKGDSAKRLKSKENQERVMGNAWLIVGRNGSRETPPGTQRSPCPAQHRMEQEGASKCTGFNLARPGGPVLFTDAPAKTNLRSWSKVGNVRVSITEER
jgi:hypothetical protein